MVVLSADEFCWGELVGELVHILARAKRMKKHQRNVDVWWDVEELSKQEKDWYLDPNNSGFKNFIHDKPYTNKADLYRIRFYGKKVRADAKPPKAELKQLDYRCWEHKIGERPICKYCDLEYMKAKYPETYNRPPPWSNTIKTRDVTALEAARAKLVPTKEEQQDVRRNGMLGEGTRDHMIVYRSNDGTITNSENVTFAEALELARNCKDCIAYVTKIVQVLDVRKTPVERAKDRVNMILDSFKEGPYPSDGEMLDLYTAVNAWKEAAGQVAWDVLKPRAPQ